MKKAMFFVSAIVTLAMGTMLVSCDKEPTNGCLCEEEGFYKGDYYYYSQVVSLQEMREDFGVSDCEALAHVWGEDAQSIKCKAR